MVQAALKERIEMRVDLDDKQLAERASIVSGCASLTEFIVRLIRENAPKILEQETTIYATNNQFNRFVAACQDTERKPSNRIIEAAQRLDADGY